MVARSRKVLPVFSNYSRGIRAIPKSSASSELTFSAAGNIVTALRYNPDEDDPASDPVPTQLEVPKEANVNQQRTIRVRS